MNKRGSGRWFAHPVLSVLIAGSWLLLQGSLAPVHLIFAVVIGLVIPRLVHRFLGAGVRVHRVDRIVRLLLIVLWDIVVANLAVAWIVLNPRSNPRPAWVHVPLKTDDPHAIVLLATIITTTPGTVSCVIDEARREILVHALDCDDAPAMAAQIDARYQAALKEIFE